MLSNNGYGVKDKLLLVMTRNEEIQNYAYNNCITDDVDDTSYSLIVETAKWADETMIEKASEGIKNNKHLHKVWSFGSLSTDWDKFIREFRKAMEL